MEDADPIPPDAKKGQLAKMLASARFRRRQKPAEVFALLVTNAINGKTLSESEIREKIFPPPYNQFASNARTAVNTVRSLIQEYYANEGHEDQVIIGLPVRERGRPASEDVSYPVTFANANTSFAIYPLKSARQYALRLTPENLYKAQRMIREYLDLDPPFLPVELFYIECLCTIAALFPQTKTEIEWKTTSLFRGESDTRKERCSVGSKQLISRALDRARRLGGMYPDSLKVLSAWATTSSLAFELAEARLVLSKIERIEPDDVVTFLPHAIYYLFIGQHGKIWDLAERFENGKREIPELLAAGFCYYLSHRRVNVFYLTLDADPLLYVAYFGSICQTLMDPEEPFEPGLFEQSEYAHERSQEREPIMPGISVLAYAREFGGLGDSPIAGKIRDCLEAMRQEPPEIRDWIQLALASLAVNQDESVAALASAVEHRQPLALFLPVWPIFDPLREREDFKLVLDRLDEIVGEPLFRFRPGEEMP